MPTSSYVRYKLEDGKYIALIMKESEFPPPEPRNEFEGIKVLTNEEVDLIRTRPQAFRYDLLVPSPLYWGEILASTERFYPDVENFEELYPDLENRVYLMARFPDMPEGVEINVRVNTQNIVLENYDNSPFELRSTEQGLFTVSLTDARCYAERPTIFLDCVPLPTE